MKNLSICLAVLMTAATAGLSPAQDPAALDPIDVKAPLQAPGERSLTAAAMDNPLTLSVAEAVKSLPGVTAVHRGANAAEPVIRGLGWERVQTQLGCLPLYGACPSRMDPPASYVSAHALQSVSVVKALPSVTLGPGGTGGRVIMDPAVQRGPDAEPGMEGTAAFTWDDGRDGYSASVKAEGGDENLDIRAEAGTADLDDYESADGKTVPAGLEEYTGSLSLGWDPVEGQRVYGSVLYKREENVDFPSLPMDIRESTAWMALGGYRILPAEGSVERMELSLGLADIDHLMDNADKPNRGIMEAETPSTAKSYAGKAEADWRISEQSVLTIGTDAERMERDATRTRRMVASGMTFRDHIWPDVTRDIVGAFAEWKQDAGDSITLRIGGRVDYAQSEAAGADDLIAVGMGSPPAPILDQYARFNGENAAVDEVDETLFSGNVLVEWAASERVRYYAGAGRVSRYPAVTEQFFAFAPAPGGYLVGNPALDPETKLEAAVGTVMTHEKGSIDISLFAAQVDDYIYQTSVARMDVNGDGAPDNIRSFRNVDAELYGAEAEGKLLLGEGWSVPASLAFVAGRNTTDGRDLPEIPPLSGEIALRFDADSETRPWWCEAGMRFAARQDKIDETFPEDETGAFEVYHLRAGVEIVRGLELEVGVENLLDEEYNEHLTREALLASGDLAPGDEVPQPGRYVYATAKVMF